MRAIKNPTKPSRDAMQHNHIISDNDHEQFRYSRASINIMDAGSAGTMTTAGTMATYTATTSAAGAAAATAGAMLACLLPSSPSSAALEAAALVSGQAVTETLQCRHSDQRCSRAMPPPPRQIGTGDQRAHNTHTPTAYPPLQWQQQQDHHHRHDYG
eukprot:scpid27602/ scgid0168/ 